MRRISLLTLSFSFFIQNVYCQVFDQVTRISKSEFEDFTAIGKPITNHPNAFSHIQMLLKADGVPTTFIQITNAVLTNQETPEGTSYKFRLLGKRNHDTKEETHYNLHTSHNLFFPALIFGENTSLKNYFEKLMIFFLPLSVFAIHEEGDIDNFKSLRQLFSMLVSITEEHSELFMANAEAAEAAGAGGAGEGGAGEGAAGAGEGAGGVGAGMERGSRSDSSFSTKTEERTLPSSFNFSADLFNALLGNYSADPDARIRFIANLNQILEQTLLLETHETWAMTFIGESDPQSLESIRGYYARIREFRQGLMQYLESITNVIEPAITPMGSDVQNGPQIHIGHGQVLLSWVNAPTLEATAMVTHPLLPIRQPSVLRRLIINPIRGCLRCLFRR